MPEKSSERTMTAICEAKALAGTIAGDGNWKVRVQRVRRHLGCTFNRAKDILYGDERISIKAEEIDRLREIKISLDSDRTRISGLRTCLAEIDPEFHGPTIEALDRALRTLGGGH